MNPERLKPDFAVAFSNLGNVLHGKEDYNGALSAYKRAIEISPEYTNAYFNLGVLLKDTKYHAETIDSFKAALRLDSEHTAATAHLLGVYGHTCSWTEAERIAPKVDKANALAIKENRDTEETPFANLMRKADPELNYNVARTWCNSISANVAALSRELSFGWSNSGRSKIRLGYLSFDFREHPIAQLSALICGLHDRSSFEVYAYSYGRDDGSVYRKRIKETCDVFRDIRDLSDREAATLINNDAIDILIDMNGHTAGARLEIPALRPAPVQMSWLGYPGPIGADFFDYFAGDSIVISREQAHYFARNLITLPHTFMITDNTAEVAASGRTREMAGLPEEQVSFCSFNQSYKIDPVMFYAWMRILKGVPESVLWLMESNPIAEGNIRKEAEIRRVEGDRIVFAEKLPVEEHLERISLADLGLDTRIYSGGTTTVNTLWAGVPVVTLKGATFCAKMSSSILTAAGLQEMITEDIENFVSLAVCLGQDRSRLHGLKEKLTKNNKTHPLFDTPRFVRNLERAYKTVWKAYRNNEQVCDIEIEDKDGDFR